MTTIIVIIICIGIGILLRSGRLFRILVDSTLDSLSYLAVIV